MNINDWKAKKKPTFASSSFIYRRYRHKIIKCKKILVANQLVNNSELDWLIDFELRLVEYLHFVKLYQRSYSVLNIQLIFLYNLMNFGNIFFSDLKKINDCSC